MKPHKIIISGGGTGGHLFPALAIAEEFQNRFSDAEILFVGALGRIEMTKVPNAGYNIIGLWVDGFQRKLPGGQRHHSEPERRYGNRNNHS